MTQISDHYSDNESAVTEEISTTVPRAGIMVSVRHHALPSAILVASTFVLFRTWIGGKYPGGTDSAFLYSGIAFYKIHGLQLFTVWLPNPLGQVSQYSLYWFLAMLTVLFRGVLFTYKIAAVSLALISVFGMYAVSYSWTKSRIAAIAAAIFYSFSPFSVGQWLSGHLDVQVSIALGPLVIWCIIRILDVGSKRAAIGLGLCGSALLLLTTGQAAYWVPVSLVIVIGKFAMSPQDIPAMLRRALQGAALSIAVFVAASSVQLIPWMFGASAAFAGGQGLSIEGLSLHANYSLPFNQNILGVPREAWLPAGVELSVASFSSPLFAVPQILLIVFASLSILVRRSLSIIFLILAVGAWYLATGPFGPTEGAYTSVWQHITFFRELRVPNRWLMISTFSLASMLALSIRAVTSYIFKKWGKASIGPSKQESDLQSTATHARLLKILCQSTFLIVISGSLLAVNDGAILSRGLPTINPPSGYIQTYSALKQTPGDWRVLTTPVGQSWMKGPIDGDPESIAADFGYTSMLFNGHSTVGNGGWDPRAAQFANFLDALVNQGEDRNIAELLGAADIRYVVIDPEAAYQVPTGQGYFLSVQHGLSRVSGGQSVTVLQNSSAQSQISQPTSSCVIAGGYPVLEDLTETPTFSVKNTALYFADQVVGTAGWNALIDILDRSHCLIMGPGAQGELTVLRNAVATVQAASISPAEWPSAPISPLTDSQADPAQSVEIPVGHSLAWNTTIHQAGSYRIWIRVLRQPSASPVSVTANGMPAGYIDPALPASVGYQWLPANAIHLTAGSVSVSLSGASTGTTPEIAEIALVHGESTWALPQGIQGSWLVRDVDGLNSNLYSQASIDFAHPLITSSWHAVSGVKVSAAHNAEVTLVPTSTDRQQFSLADAYLPKSIDPNDPLALRFQGTGSGARFYLNFYFQDGSRKSFGFLDSSNKPRTLFFIPDEGGAAVRAGNPSGSNNEVPKWGQLVRLTLSTNSLFSPGGVVHVDGPFPLRSPHAFPYFIGQLPSSRVSSQSNPQPTAEMISTGAQIENAHQGILNFSQSFDPHWRLSGAQSQIHTVELGFENSYFLADYSSRVKLKYSLAVIGESGTLISLAVWIIALNALILWPSLVDMRWTRRQRRSRGKRLHRRV